MPCSGVRCFLILILCLPASFAVAQEDRVACYFDVTSRLTEQERFADYSVAMDDLATSLTLRGGIRSETKGTLFLVGFSEEGEAGQIALSVTVLSRLPEPIVQLGKEAEAFYLRGQARATPLDPAGTSVRQYMSESYMREFYNITSLFVELTTLADLPVKLDQIAERFVKDHTRQEP